MKDILKIASENSNIRKALLSLYQKRSSEKGPQSQKKKIKDLTGKKAPSSEDDLSTLIAEISVKSKGNPKGKDKKLYDALTEELHFQEGKRVGDVSLKDLKKSVGVFPKPKGDIESRRKEKPRKGLRKKASGEMYPPKLLNVLEALTSYMYNKTSNSSNPVYEDVGNILSKMRGMSRTMKSKNLELKAKAVYYKTEDIENSLKKLAKRSHEDVKEAISKPVAQALERVSKIMKGYASQKKLSPQTSLEHFSGRILEGISDASRHSTGNSTIFKVLGGELLDSGKAFRKKTLKQEGRDKERGNSKPSWIFYLAVANHPKYKQAFRVPSAARGSNEKVLAATRIKQLYSGGMRMENIQKDPEIAKSMEYFEKVISDPRRKEQLLKLVKFK